MPTIRHEYLFRCVRCKTTRNSHLKGDDYDSGRVNIYDVTPNFNFAASLDFSQIRFEDAINDYIRSGRFIVDATGDLCDDCFFSLVEWFRS